MTYTFTNATVNATINNELIEKLALVCANDCIEDGAAINENKIQYAYDMMLADEGFIDEETGDSMLCENTDDVIIVLDGVQVFPIVEKEEDETMTKEMVKEFFTRANSVTKVQADGYVSREELAAFMEKLTGKTYGLRNKKNTRKAMMEELAAIVDEYDSVDEYAEKLKEKEWERQCDEMYLEEFMGEIARLCNVTLDVARELWRVAEEVNPEYALRRFCDWRIAQNEGNAAKEGEILESVAKQIAPAPVKEEAPAPVEEDPRWSVDYWWNAEVCSMVLNKVFVHMSRPEQNRQDVIAKDMVRSFIFEIMFGKQYKQYVNKQLVVNFSAETTPKEWKLCDDFYNKFYERYLHDCGDKSACVNSEIMAWKYKKVQYAIKLQSGHIVRYDLDYNTRTLVRRDNGNIYDLTPDAFKKLDATCSFVKAIRE